jgi:hypothetical protein
MKVKVYQGDSITTNAYVSETIWEEAVMCIE